jgi:hypothetical protein
MKAVRLSAQRTGHLYPQGNIGYLVLIPVTGGVRSEGPSGIEHATFRLIAQCLNQLRHCVPVCLCLKASVRVCVRAHGLEVATQTRECLASQAFQQFATPISCNRK